MRMPDFEHVSLFQRIPLDAFYIVAAMRLIEEFDVRIGFAQRQPG